MRQKNWRSFWCQENSIKNLSMQLLKIFCKFSNCIYCCFANQYCTALLYLIIAFLSYYQYVLYTFGLIATFRLYLGDILNMVQHARRPSRSVQAKERTTGLWWFDIPFAASNEASVIKNLESICDDSVLPRGLLNSTCRAWKADIDFSSQSHSHPILICGTDSDLGSSSHRALRDRKQC